LIDLESTTACLNRETLMTSLVSRPDKSGAADLAKMNPRMGMLVDA